MFSMWGQERRLQEQQKALEEQQRLQEQEQQKMLKRQAQAETVPFLIKAPPKNDQFEFKLKHSPICCHITAKTKLEPYRTAEFQANLEDPGDFRKIYMSGVCNHFRLLNSDMTDAEYDACIEFLKNGFLRPTLSCNGW